MRKIYLVWEDAILVLVGASSGAKGNEARRRELGAG